MYLKPSSSISSYNLPFFKSYELLLLKQFLFSKPNRNIYECKIKRVAVPTNCNAMQGNGNKTSSILKNATWVQANGRPCSVAASMSAPGKAFVFTQINKI